MSFWEISRVSVPLDCLQKRRKFCHWLIFVIWATEGCNSPTKTPWKIKAVHRKPTNSPWSYKGSVYISKKFNLGAWHILLSNLTIYSQIIHWKPAKPKSQLLRHFPMLNFKSKQEKKSGIQSVIKFIIKIISFLLLITSYI
jgi:hypothetical protein